MEPQVEREANNEASPQYMHIASEKTFDVNAYN